MDWKKLTREYFFFTRRDRIGTMVILGLIVLTLVLPVFFPGKHAGSAPGNDTAWMAALQKIEVREELRENDDNPALYTYDRSPNRYNENTGQLFYFDPNTLSPEGWKKLGLRDKTIKTIQNYLSKGGRFRKPEDLQKVYGLRKDLYEKLLPFVQISNTKEPFPIKKDSTIASYPQKVTRSPTIIDINTADTTAFISLPGIGSKLASRIVSFRERLGGFYSIEQIAETFGLHDSLFRKSNRD